MEYTVEVWKLDKRLRAGKKIVNTISLEGELREVESTVRGLALSEYPPPKFALELHETWDTVLNLMTGKPVRERYNTPYYLSVASESYWSA